MISLESWIVAKEIVRDCVDMIQDMIRDCRHTTEDGQRLQTYYRRWSETADMIEVCPSSDQCGKTLINALCVNRSLQDITKRKK